jgi:hypothetical protein
MKRSMRSTLVWGVIADLENWRRSMPAAVIIRDDDALSQLESGEACIGLAHAPTERALLARFPSLHTRCLDLLPASQSTH